MKPRSLNVYACPSCRGALRLAADAFDGEEEVITGTLTCLGCGATYPVRGGVPRFVRADGYAASFAREWNWFRTVQIDAHTGTDVSRRAFRGATGWIGADLSGRLVLDAGAGAGRYAECAAAQGAEVYGVDLTGAIDAAYKNVGRHPRVHLAQADIFALPFREGTFDLAYSIGVLHHTPDPPAAFARVAAMVRPAGEMAIYVYSRYGPSHRVTDAIRAVTTRVPPRLMLAASTVAIPLYYVYRLPLVGRALRLALPISLSRNWRERWLDTFDWYTPKYQFKYLYPEIYRWFEDNGFHEVRLFDDPIRMRAVKGAVHARLEQSRLVAS